MPKFSIPFIYPEEGWVDKETEFTLPCWLPWAKWGLVKFRFSGFSGGFEGEDRFGNPHPIEFSTPDAPQEQICVWNNEESNSYHAIYAVCIDPRCKGMHFQTVEVDRDFNGEREGLYQILVAAYPHNKAGIRGNIRRALASLWDDPPADDEEKSILRWLYLRFCGGWRP